MYCENTKQRLIGESIGYYTSKPLVHKLWHLTVIKFGLTHCSISCKSS